jgi:hypothetical protein
MPPEVSIEDLQRYAAERRGRARHSPLSRIGLQIDDPEIEFLRCDATPLDGVLVAHTGGDGVHFCALPTHGPSSASWPIVMVVPGHPDQPRLVVGATLWEFLGLGSVAGFTLLEQLLYDRARALAYLVNRQAFLSYCSPTPEVRDELREDIRADEAVLQHLRDTFRLVPWQNAPERLAQLQAAHAGQIRIAPA